MKYNSTVFSFSSLCLVLLFTASINAQPHAAGEPVRIIGNEAQQFQQPKWSPDGSSLAFTSPEYKGIWISDADGGNITSLSDEEGAGFGFSWSSDSQSILARVSVRDGVRRNHAVKVFNTENHTSRELTEYRSRMPVLPVWSEFDDKVILSQNSRVEILDSGIEVSQMRKSAEPKPVAVASGDRIAIGTVTHNNFERVSPFDDATYLNVTQSPDGEKIAFEVMGGNLYVMNTDGSGLTGLGRANQPAWSPDSEYLVVQMSEDDGHVFLESDVYIISIDGTYRENLTASVQIKAMNPAWSPDGSQIAFDSNDGSIYLLPVTR